MFSIRIGDFNPRNKAELTRLGAEFRKASTSVIKEREVYGIRSQIYSLKAKNWLYRGVFESMLDRLLSYSCQ